MTSRNRIVFDRGIECSMGDLEDFWWMRVDGIGLVERGEDRVWIDVGLLLMKVERVLCE